MKTLTLSPHPPSVLNQQFLMAPFNFSTPVKFRDLLFSISFFFVFPSLTSFFHPLFPTRFSSSDTVYKIKMVGKNIKVGEKAMKRGVERNKEKNFK